MKFRDPKTGEVFENIVDARIEFCMGEDCEKCSMPNVCLGNLPDDSCTCLDFAEKHPLEAARLMGYDVVGDVEVVEHKDCDGCLHEDKRGVEYPCSACSLAYSSKYVSKPCFTEEEVVFLRHVESIFPGSSVKMIADSAFVIEANKRGKWALPAELLPSLRPGQSVALADIVGA